MTRCNAAIETQIKVKNPKAPAASSRSRRHLLSSLINEKKNRENCREAAEQPKHPSLAGHRRVLRGHALAVSRILRPAVLDLGPTQFRIVKNGIDVKSGTPFDTGNRGRHIMRVDRNVMLGLIALIAIGFVAIIVGGYVH